MNTPRTGPLPMEDARHIAQTAAREAADKARKAFTYAAL